MAAHNLKITIMVYKVLQLDGEIKAMAHDEYKLVTISEIDNFDFTDRAVSLLLKR